MPAITPSAIANRLGKTVSSPAAVVNVGPVTTDIGGTIDPTIPGPSSLCHIFDVTLPAVLAGDTVDFTIPDSIKELTGRVGGPGATQGLDISVLPLSADGVTAAPHVVQTTSIVRLTFTAGAAIPAYRIKIDGRHSIGR